MKLRFKDAERGFWDIEYDWNGHRHLIQAKYENGSVLNLSLPANDEDDCALNRYQVMSEIASHFAKWGLYFAGGKQDCYELDD